MHNHVKPLFLEIFRMYAKNTLVSISAIRSFEFKELINIFTEE